MVGLTSNFTKYLAKHHKDEIATRVATHMEVDEYESAAEPEAEECVPSLSHDQGSYSVNQGYSQNHGQLRPNRRFRRDSTLRAILDTLNQEGRKLATTEANLERVAASETKTHQVGEATYAFGSRLEQEAHSTIVPEQIPGREKRQPGGLKETVDDLAYQIDCIKGNLGSCLGHQQKLLLDGECMHAAIMKDLGQVVQQALKGQ